MIHNLTHDEYATEYVKGVREANPQEYPTWEMLETAFVAGMTLKNCMDNPAPAGVTSH